MFLANKLNKGAGSPVALDAQFNYVTMLLHGDGTNGAQNNTFLDSSTNNLTITRNGNTTQGSFSPYGSNWSNYFDGSGDYLSIADNAAFEFGSGNFTIEGWINPSALPSGLYSIVTKSDGTGGAYAPYLIGRNGSSIIVRMSSNGSSWDIVNGTSFGTLTVGQWFHFALVRNGTAITGYLNGVGTSIATTSASLWDNSNSLLIGAVFASGGIIETWNGYISNVRLVKGTAVYTSNFTPPTAPLTSISGTSLLTCQSNRFKDNSTNNFTISSFGNTSVQRFNPFGASTAYSTSVIGGSGYFDGTGDYLTVPDNSAFNLGSSNFTAECWAYFTSNSAQYVFGQIESSADNRSFLIAVIASKLYFEVRSGSTAYSITAASNVVINQWLHIAAVRDGNTITLYQNGVSIGTVSVAGVTVNNSTNPLGVGCGGGYVAQPMIGYISNARLVVGTAVYTSAFTPPTAPLTAITNTQLLTSMTNGAIFDNAMMNDLETVGNAQISTSVVKYGTGSMYFDGDTDYVGFPKNENVNFGSGNFTIEFWVNWIAFGSDKKYCISVTNGSNYWQFNHDSSTGVGFLYNNGSGATIVINQGNNSGWSTGTWYHVALVRNGTALTVYRNGTSLASGTLSVALTNQTTFCIGGSAGFPTTTMNGYIDDLRITKGYARYTANFTPPTAAFPNTGPI